MLMTNKRVVAPAVTKQLKHKKDMEERENRELSKKVQQEFRLQIIRCGSERREVR